MKKLLMMLLLFTSLGALASEPAARSEYAWSPDNVTINATPPLFDTLRNSPVDTLYSIERASVSAADKLEAMGNWNLLNRPMKNGFSHTFPSAATIEIQLPSGSLESGEAPRSGSDKGRLLATDEGDVLWSASVEVENAHRLRLRLTDVELPDHSKLWVYGDGDEVVGPFGYELAGPSGDIWTPSVAGPVIKLVVLLPASHPSGRFSMAQVAELFELNSAGQPVLYPEEETGGDLSCLKQSLCFDTDTFSKIAEVEKAVGQMNFMINGEGVVCTGTLINDNDTTTTKAYFLSANHCFGTQEVASTLEVVWDWTSDSCDGPEPDYNSKPKSNGSTLRATGVPADFLLLELNSIPSDRLLLGWTVDAAAVAPGQVLHRVHHPAGMVHHYSQSRVMDGVQACDAEWTTDTHVWQSSVLNGTIGGSSGSAILTADGLIVGQLSGSCGSGVQCNLEDPEIDGKLASYFPQIAQFLNPTSGGNDTSDLSLASVSAQSGSFAPGSSLNVSIRVDNVGNAASSSYTITYYASTDTSITSGDYNLGSLNRAEVASAGSDEFSVSVTLPGSIPAGSYYIGAIVSVSDANAGNNSGYDTSRITVTGGSSSSFTINAGLNGSWYNASMSGQGLLIDVLTASNQVFAAWFTFDSVRPPSSYTAILGEAGLRWLTALGPISGNKAVLTAYLANGGVFASSSPPVEQNASGTITLTFHNCKEATLDYNIPGVGSGSIGLIRLTFDGVALCESMQ